MTRDADELITCRYTVLDKLGQGTFGQVVKCMEEDTGELVAVKVIKNKPAYTQQGRVERDLLSVV